jgi:hypothetical protein
MIVTDATVWVSHLVAQNIHHAVSHRWLTDVVNGGTNDKDFPHAPCVHSPEHIPLGEILRRGDAEFTFSKLKEPE